MGGYADLDETIVDRIHEELCGNELASLIAEAHERATGHPDEADIHARYAVHWDRLAFAVRAGFLARMDIEDVMAATADAEWNALDDGTDLRAAVTHLNTPVTTSGAAT